MRRWAWATALLLMGSGFGTSTSVLQRAEQGPPTAAPVVPEGYTFLNGSGEGWAIAQKSFPILSISISRQGCFGTCPVYSATLRSDDAATFTGGRHSNRMGNHSGRIHFGDFARLALFVEQSGFMQYEGRYTAPWTDAETVVVAVIMRDGTTKTVSHYGQFGPPNLWILEQAIDAVIARIEWRAVS